MFTVKEDSWHYRFAERVSSVNDIPENLCPYVRRVILGIMVFCFFTFILAFIAVTTIVNHVAWGLYGWEYLNGAQKISVLIPWICILAIGGVVGCVALDIWFCKFRQRRAEFHAARELLPREPGLIVSYYRAWHDKICPKIEVEVLAKRRERERERLKRERQELDEIDQLLELLEAKRNED